MPLIYKTLAKTFYSCVSLTLFLLQLFSEFHRLEPLMMVKENGQPKKIYNCLQDGIDRYGKGIQNLAEKWKNIPKWIKSLRCETENMVDELTERGK